MSVAAVVVSSSTAAAANTFVLVFSKARHGEREEGEERQRGVSGRTQNGSFTMAASETVA